MTNTVCCRQANTPTPPLLPLFIFPSCFPLLTSETLHYTNHLRSFTPYFYCPILSFLSFTLSVSVKHYSGLNLVLVWSNIPHWLPTPLSLSLTISVPFDASSYSYVSLSFAVSQYPYSCLLDPHGLMDRKYKQTETTRNRFYHVIIMCFK